MNFKEDIKALSLWSGENKSTKRCENFILKEFERIEVSETQ